MPGRRIKDFVHTSRQRVLDQLRNWFLTGVVVAAPIGITTWLVWSFISFVDNQVKPLVPRSCNPETYLEFALPGLGLVFAVVALIALGALTQNFLGRTLLGIGERIVERVPLVRFIYRGLKQVFETFTANDATAFKEAVMVEYPGPGLWALAFVTNRQPGGEIAERRPGSVAVFVPTSPNPATGFLVYVDPARVQKLDMPVDQAAKLIFSIGILTPEQLKAQELQSAPAT
jgi:uncharacterized membrane protein